MAELARVRPAWHWLLGELGWALDREWPAGCSWRRGDAYVVLEQSPAVLSGAHERTRPGWNHVALWAGPAEALDALVAAAPAHGWRLMFADRQLAAP